MYVELHCKTNYSFLTGASHPDELIARAVQLGYSAMAVTDENTVAGVVRAYAAARETSLKLIIGAEIILNDAPPVVLWAADRKSYAHLTRLLTVGRRRAPKGQCWLSFEDVAHHAEGLIAGIVPYIQGDRSRTDHIDPTHPSYPWFRLTPSRRRRLQDGSAGACGWALNNYRDLFGDRAYLLAELYRGVDDHWRIQQLQKLSTLSRLPLVAAGDVLYHVPARLPLHDVLTATKHRTTVAQAGDLLLPNAQRHLQTIHQRQNAFARIPDAVSRTLEIADRCGFCLRQLRYEYPEELAPDGKTPMQYLHELTASGAKNRYPNGIPEKVQHQINHELVLIDQLHYEAYFLTVWDLVRFARSRGILCQGRGSAANSAVCYALGITSVDPDTTDLLFERFVSKERDEPPDIDVDFEHQRREEVLQYLYEKYGRDRAGLAATVITYRVRSAVRDVGKALGLSLDRVDALAKHVEGYSHDEQLTDRMRDVGIDPDTRIGQQLNYLVNEIIGFPRHLSQHVGGMVITRGKLDELVPIENAAMDDRTVIQWDKDDLEELGLLKVDCLCLGMLTAIRQGFQLVGQHWGRHLTLATVPKEDPKVYDMICQADTVGVFQIESRGQMSMLPRLKPRCWYDLVIEVAIVRPGPIQGNMVHPFLRRRNGQEEVIYPNDEIKAVLHRTLGVPIFQEQAMKLAVVAAGFTPGQADQLRRAMGAWRKSGVIEQFQEKLMTGMRQKGLSEEFANQVFRQIRGFGEYGFPESHAASFAKLVYVSAWLKLYYPAAFCAAIINSQPMGFYAPAQLVSDARDHGVEVLPVDVNHSQWDCTIECGMRNAECGKEEECGARKAEGGMQECRSDNFKSQISNLKSQISATSPAAKSNPPSENKNSALRIPHSAFFFSSDLRIPHSDLPSENHSAFRTPHSAFSPPLRLGLRMISGLRADHAETIVRARRDGRFTSVADFARRTRLGSATITLLSQADAFGSLDQDRRQALWQALAQEKKPLNQPLLDRLEAEDDLVSSLPTMSLQQQVVHDYRSVGLSLKAHPMSFYRQQLDSMRITKNTRSQKIGRDSQFIRVAGLVILRQRPSTAKGITFVTIEDETGTANLVVKQNIWQRYYKIARRSPAWIAYGKLEKKNGVIHVVVNRLEDMSDRLKDLAIKSRDFR